MGFSSFGRPSHDGRELKLELNRTTPNGGSVARHTTGVN